MKGFILNGLDNEVLGTVYFWVLLIDLNKVVYLFYRFWVYFEEGKKVLEYFYLYEVLWIFWSCYIFL